MLVDTKLIYNGIYVNKTEYDIDMYYKYENGTKYSLDTDQHFTHDYTISMLVGSTYVLGPHFLCTLLEGWKYIPTEYNMYHIIKKVAIKPIEKWNTFYEPVETDFFYARTELQFYDWFYAD